MTLEFDRLGERAALIRHYTIKRRPLSHEQKFVIYDERDLCLYTFKSTYLAIGDKLAMIEEATGKKVMTIREQLGHFHTFNIYGDGQLGSIQRMGPPWNRRLMITSVFGAYEINRQGVSHEYILTKDGQIVAKIKKKVLAETYLVDVVEDLSDNEITFVLAMIIVLWCAGGS